MFKAHLLAPLALLTLSACAEPVQPRFDSSDTYRASEANRAMNVANCTVKQSRYVAIVDDQQGSRDTANQIVGIGAGALIGRAIGNEIGGGSGRDLAKTLGTIAGGAVGSNVASNVNNNRNTRTGVEYTVDLGSNGSRTIVQNLNANEAPLRTGQSCVVVGSGSMIRVQGA
jgi:outer membrane lipoprotein SlyB